LACGSELKVLIQPLEIEDDIIFSLIEDIKIENKSNLKLIVQTALELLITH